MPERLNPSTSAGQFDLFGKRSGPRIYTVSELTREIKGVLEGRFPQLLVKGEVSNCKRSSMGHVYFTLKDDNAVLDAAVFRNEARRLKFDLRNGMSVVARGSVQVYEPRGGYQLVCDTVEPMGAGALQVAFEQLKEKLQKEGLFDRAKKRRLPFIARRIAVVTSPGGAAVHDFIRVLHRRFPGLPVLIVPVRVQGEGAAGEIARGIVRAAKQRNVEVVVVARGGGSLEDLWAFNEEVVARSLAACPVPTVSAVGHEVDVTIADFVADLRAPTPTAAAELLAPVRDELQADLTARRARLLRAARQHLERKRAQLEKGRARLQKPLVADRQLRLDKLRQRLEDAFHAAISLRQTRLQKLTQRLRAQHPAEKLHRLHRQIAQLHDRLAHLARRALVARRERFVKLAASLDAYSPLKVLARGYSVTFDAQGRALTSSAQVQPGERVRVRLHEGELDAHVTSRK